MALLDIQQQFSCQLTPRSIGLFRPFRHIRGIAG